MNGKAQSVWITFIIMVENVVLAVICKKEQYFPEKDK